MLRVSVFARTGTLVRVAYRDDSRTSHGYGTAMSLGMPLFGERLARPRESGGLRPTSLAFVDLTGYRCWDA